MAANIKITSWDMEGLFTFDIDGIPYAYRIDPADGHTARSLMSISVKKCFNYCKKRGARLMHVEDDIWNSNPNKPYERWRIGQKVIAYIGINPDTKGKAVIFEALGDKKGLVVRIKLNLGEEIEKLKWIVKTRL
jgi:hypothetical protein